MNRFHRPIPCKKSGNLYYVRLKTECGIFYKLGFTSLNSVHERLGYGGSNDAQYIDKVLLFVYLDDASEVENKLHSYLSDKKAFGKYSAAKEFPLSKNGQTELYIEDVLRLDSAYSEKQGEVTKRQLRNKRLLILGKSHNQANFEDLVVKVVTRVLSVLLLPLAIVLITLFSKLDGQNTKDELMKYFDRMTGSKKKFDLEEATLKANIDKVIAHIKREGRASEV
tara:strand:- start:10339 stop:11010 length:672 start_codon:yes stop_codon:yes gene_type:complete